MSDDDIKTTELLLRDPNVDIETLEEAFLSAVDDNRPEIVVLFLRDRRVNPTTERNHAIREASREGFSTIVALLLNDGRANPAAEKDLALVGAVRNGHEDVVALLLQDKRANPASSNNYPIFAAAQAGRLDIVALLLQDERVRKAPLPRPNPKARDPLARALAEIIALNVDAPNTLAQVMTKTQKRLAEFNLISHILSYHPHAIKRRGKRKATRSFVPISEHFVALIDSDMEDYEREALERVAEDYQRSRRNRGNMEDSDTD